MPDEPVPDDAAGLRAANARLRAVVEAKDGQVAMLTAALDAALERERRLGLRLAEVERRLGMDSTDSGTPSSKERIGVKEARRARQQSERERSKDRRRGGQPGHQGRGLKRDPDPGDKRDVPPPAECRSCRGPLDGAETVEPRWAQVIDVEFVRKVTEWALPGLSCPCCGTVTFAEPPAGAHQGSVSYGPALNAAAVLLSCYGNVPPERAAQVIAMLLGVPVSAGFVDKAATRLSAQLGRAGFEEAMLAALTAEDVLAADETPVNVLDGTAPAAGEEEGDPEERDGKTAGGFPHALITRTPDGRLAFFQAIASRRKSSVAAAIPPGFAGYLITDGYTGYQHLLSRLAGIQQCCQHVIRRCRAVTKLGPGGVQSWGGDIIAVLRDAHAAVEAARARGDTALDQKALNDLRERYDQAVSFGIIHNRLRDWDTGNHPGYALGCWLRDYKEQVFLFTREFAVSWTNNVSERGAKAAKRHQAVSGYWHSLGTLARWCRLRSYLDTAAAHGTTALDAIRAAIEGKPWLPPLAAIN
ncbi:MAG: transposase [Actinomycetia bacterium]|nr:transposase [Actinomycetes bacterium]